MQFNQWSNAEHAENNMPDQSAPALSRLVPALFHPPSSNMLVVACVCPKVENSPLHVHQSGGNKVHVVWLTVHTESVLQITPGQL